MGKTRKTQKHGAAAGYDSDRKHLTGREVEKLIDAPRRAAGTWSATVACCFSPTGMDTGFLKSVPCPSIMWTLKAVVACEATETRVIDNAPATHR
jgi:hypothetical protein